MAYSLYRIDTCGKQGDQIIIDTACLCLRKQSGANANHISAANYPLTDSLDIGSYAAARNKTDLRSWPLHRPDKSRRR